jgi:hypothetical protein
VSVYDGESPQVNQKENPKRIYSLSSIITNRQFCFLFASHTLPRLVVEETGLLLNKRDSALLRRIVDRLVVDGSTRRSRILDTRRRSAENVVHEGEL